EEVLVERVGLQLAGLPCLLLQQELGALLVGVGELRVPRAELHPADHRVDVLGETRIVSMRSCERRHLTREVADERGLDQPRLDELLEQLERDLARGPGWIDGDVAPLRELGEVRALERDLLPDGLRDAPEDRHAAPLPAEIDLVAPERDLERAGHPPRAPPPPRWIWGPRNETSSEPATARALACTRSRETSIIVS